MLLSTKGIVIQSIKYGENSLISKVVSQEKGLITLISNRSKNKKNKQANFFHPLSAVFFTCYLSNKSNIHRVKEVSFNKDTQANKESIISDALRFFIAEFLCKVIREEEKNSNLYSFIENEVIELNSETTSLGDFHIRFLIKFLSILGIQPHLNPEDTFFDLREGTSTSNKPAHKDFYEMHHYSLLLNYSTIKNPISKADKKDLLDLLICYYNIQLGGGIENLKSKSVLEVVFE